MIYMELGHLFFFMGDKRQHGMIFIIVNSKSYHVFSGMIYHLGHGLLSSPALFV